MNDQELRKMINPSYSTGKGCLLLQMGSGDPVILKIGEMIDISEIRGKSNAMEADPTLAEISKTYAIGNYARYNIWERLVEQTDCDVIVDLPCGYLPHGIFAAKAGKQYYGFDLPVVIDEFKPAMEKICGNDPAIHIAAVDATNYDSMKQALKGAKGKLCIIMDGLLGFFNPSELKEVCTAIKSLLSEYGGVWYTPDALSGKMMTLCYEALWQKDSKILEQVMHAGSGSAAQIDNSINPFVSFSYDEKKKLMEEQGFAVREIPWSEIIGDLPQTDPAMMKRIRQNYAKMFEWKLTVKEKSVTTASDDDFSVTVTRSGDTTAYEIRGRLDTIHAPELMHAFENAVKTEKIVINAKNMEYISSSGLRVLLVMRKSVKDNSCLRVQGCSDAVKEIFEVTGFDSMFEIV